MPNIVELFQSIAQGIRGEFDVVRQIPHRGESGRGTEEVLKSFLKRHLPARFDVSAGFVVGRDGAVSRQCDVLVVDALNCPQLLRTEGIGMFPVDGVVSLIEVTQRLHRTKCRTDGVKIAQVRGMESALQGWYIQDFQDSAPLGVIFAESSESPLRGLAEWLADRWRETGVKRLLANSIVVVDSGMILYADKGGNLHWDPYNATAVAVLSAPDAPGTVLLLFLLFILGRARTLIEHRIRARGRWILAIRRPNNDPGADPIQSIVDAMGAEPYFGDFTPYFSVSDREIVEQLVHRVELVPVCATGGGGGGLSKM